MPIWLAAALLAAGTGGQLYATQRARNDQLRTLAAGERQAKPLRDRSLATILKSGEQYTYRCTGNDGKKYYGSTIPNACIGRPLELINKQGLVVKRIDPEGDEKARIAKEAEAEKKREQEAATQDARRRNRALLATYTSEKDIEDSRARDLRNHERGVHEVEKRIEDIRKRQAQFQKEIGKYVDQKEVARLWRYVVIQ